MRQYSPYVDNDVDSDLPYAYDGSRKHSACRLPGIQRDERRPSQDATLWEGSPPNSRLSRLVSGTRSQQTGDSVPVIHSVEFALPRVGNENLNEQQIQEKGLCQAQ